MMGFIEVAILFVAWTYACWGHLGLEEVSVPSKPSYQPTFKPSKQQSKVVARWAQEASHDDEKAA